MSAGLAPDISRWSDAVLAAVVVAVAPQSIGGIIVKGQCGPVRDAWFALVKAWLPAALPLRRIPVDVADGRLIGGLDLAATLSQGHPVAERGLLAAADGGVIVLPSAERAGKPALAAIAGALDCGQISVERDGITAINEARFGVIAFDESRDGEDTIAALLRDRLAIEIDLDAIRLRDAVSMAIAPGIFENARAAMVDVRFSDHDAQALCGTAAALGIASMRAPLQALCVARALAAFGGSPEISAENLEAAVRLVLVPRATQIPADTASQNDDPPEPELQANETPGDPPPEQPDREHTADELEAMLLAAVKALLPPGLLENLRHSASARKAKSAAGRAGAVKMSQKTYGRRAGSRRGDPRSGGRLDLLETIRAAAPWQTLRRRDRAMHARAAEVATAAPRLEIRRDDFRIRRFKHQSETATIFVVDASGSAALHRLAEAKGAVELLLADCYARRDHVALIAFRGKTADLLLPPTRSLVRAKRSLAGLPGGGGTPLATAADQACELGKVARRKGQTPTLVFLTDGRANINRSGAPGRASAQDDAHAAARLLKAEGLPAIVIDTSSHPGKDSKVFADVMGATYVPLPYADAATLSTAIRQVSK